MGWSSLLSPHNLGHVFREQAGPLGLTVRDEWIRYGIKADTPGAGWQELRDIWRARAEKPDGLLICDDVLYRDAAIAIRELGIHVPDDLMVVTHCNKGLVTPHDFPVTLLEADTEAYAAALAEGTLAILRGETPPQQQIVFGHKLRVSGGVTASSQWQPVTKQETWVIARSKEDTK